MLALVLACSSPPEPTETGPVSTADTGPHRDTASSDTALRDTAPHDTAPRDTAPDDGLVGEPIEPPLDPPAFVVENQRGETRTPEWLAGDPTVLWFFRDAGST